MACLQDHIPDFVTVIRCQACAETGVHIVRGVLARDHVHMFLSVPPPLAILDGDAEDQGVFLPATSGITPNEMLPASAGSPLLGNTGKLIQSIRIGLAAGHSVC